MEPRCRRLLRDRRDRGENNGIPQYHLYLDHYGIGTYDSSAAITPGKWTFVAMTYDGADTLNFYINGQAAGTVSGQLYNYNINTYTIAGNLIGGRPPPSAPSMD